MEATTEGIIRRLRGLMEDPSHPRAIEFLDIAADRLEMLEAEVARLKAKQRWIPVTEPPLKQERVWIYYKNWAGKWVCNVGWWSGDAWYHRDDTPGPYGWGIAHEVPTHWMPLPGAPKE